MNWQWCDQGEAFAEMQTLSFFYLKIHHFFGILTYEEGTAGL